MCFSYSLELSIGDDLDHDETFEVDIHSTSIDTTFLIVNKSNNELVSESTRYLKHDETYEIVCAIAANPVPTSARLLMKQCVQCDSNDDWQQLDDIERTVGSAELALIWRMSAEYTMTIKCESHRDGREYSMTKELIVSDLMNDDIDMFIEHYSPSNDPIVYDQIYEMDHVIIECKANKFGVESVKLTRSTNDDDDDEEELDELNGYRFERVSGTFSNVHRWHIDNVHSGHSGVYRCRARFTDSTTSIRRERLDVSRQLNIKNIIFFL